VISQGSSHQDSQVLPAVSNYDRLGGITGLMAKIVNSYRFLDAIPRRMMKHWATLGAPRKIPWSPLPKPMSQCTVSMVSSAAVALKTDQPFDQEIERRDPWSSDPSYRVLPRATTTGEVRVYHLHINASFAQQDLNCVMPLERLRQLEAEGEIGRSASSHYSYMGYTVRPEALLRHTVPGIIRQLRQEEVDAVVLVPV
jgi:D-proline reductase (dithiol) PrdB